MIMDLGPDTPNQPASGERSDWRKIAEGKRKTYKAMNVDSNLMASG